MLRNKLRRRAPAYRGDGFTVRIVPGQREVVSIIHERGGVRLELGGERVGKKWDAIEVRIPQEIEAARASQVARDLEEALRAKRLGYVISRALGTEIVPESERQAARAELRGMGFEAQVSADGTTVNLTKIIAPGRSAEESRKLTARMMALVAAVRGKRRRFKILAQSKRITDDTEGARNA